MKIKPEHVEYIKRAILADSKAPLLSEYLSKGLSEKRWRWDLLWRAKISQWISDNIYPYANDDHIDTALKYILKTPLKKNPFDDFKVRGSHFFTVLFHGPKKSAISEATLRKIPFEVLESYKNSETGRFETIGKVSGNSEFALKKWEQTGEVRKVDYQKMSLNPIPKSRDKKPLGKGWRKMPSIMTGGKPFFWTRRNEQGLREWYFWDRVTRSWKLTTDNPKSRSKYKHKRLKSARAFDARKTRKKNPIKKYLLAVESSGQKYFYDGKWFDSAESKAHRFESKLDAMKMQDRASKKFTKNALINFSIIPVSVCDWLM